jgi:superfamily I DNA/RNA helicase
VEWSDKQEAVFNFVENGTGNAIVEAVAGSGKTTTIVEASKRMSGSVAIAAFNKSMGLELKDKTSKLSHVEAGTFHSFGYKSLLKSGKVSMDNDKISKIVDEIAEYDSRIRSYRAFIGKTVSIAKQHGLGIVDKNVESYPQWKEIVEHYGTDEALKEEFGELEKKIERGIAFSIDVLKKSNKKTDIVDFDDMIYLPLLWDVKITTYDWVLVDEAQDTNPARRMLTRKMLSENGRMIAVGDPRQAIFGFTGADNASLKHISEEFNAITLPLSITYRCPKKIVKEARKIVDHIECAPEAPEGVISHAEYDVLPTIKLDNKGAVLCRYNKPLVKLFFALVRQGIGCQILGRDFANGLTSLCYKWKIKHLSVFTERLEHYRAREIGRAKESGKEYKIDSLNDKIDTLMVLIDRASERGLDLQGLINMIKVMFTADNKKKKNILTLCSVHKAKGLEWPSVYIIGRDTLMPSKYAKKDWERVQENNLIYVALTRSQNKLIYVNYTDDKHKKA